MQNPNFRNKVWIQPKSEKVQVEDAFFILGKPGEAYAVNTVDNLVMVHFMNSKVRSKEERNSKRYKNDEFTYLSLHQVPLWL